ncbi:MAG: aldo/keto reductase, partial [Chloroflexota bacterium]
RLQTDYVDLYQSHSDDSDIPLEETLRAYDDLIKQGKVRFIGASNYNANRLKEALAVSEEHNLARYETLQPHHNMVHRPEFEAELAAVCVEHEIGVIPYSPLAGGFLTGKYQKNQPAPEDARGKNSARIKTYSTDKNWGLLELIEKIGTEKGGYSISQIALAWQNSMPVITSPIIGPRTLAQMEDNLGAVGLRLAPNEMALLNTASA